MPPHMRSTRTLGLRRPVRATNASPLLTSGTARRVPQASFYLGSFPSIGPGELLLARGPLLAAFEEDLGDLVEGERVGHLDRHALLGAAPLDPCLRPLGQVILRVAA